MANKVKTEEEKTGKTLISDLADMIQERGLRVTFGLQPKDIAIIEKHISKFERAIYSYHIWVDIGREMGWDALTAALYYFDHLATIDRAGLDKMYEEIMSHQTETICSPIRAEVVSVSDIKKVFEKYGVKEEAKF